MNSKKHMSQKELKIKRSVQNTIPYNKMFRDGIAELEQNRYSATMRFTDINYQIASDDDRNKIFTRWMMMANSLVNDVGVQWTIHNHTVNEEEFHKQILIKHRKDGLNDYREECNSMLMNKQRLGKNVIISDKMVTFAVEEESYDEAYRAIQLLSNEYKKAFRSMGCDITGYHIMNGEERLQEVYQMFFPKEKLQFNYDHMGGLTTKDAIAPASVDFSKKDIFRIDDRYCKCFFLKNYSTELSDDYISDFSRLEYNITINFHMVQVDNVKAVSLVKAQIAKMEMQKTKEQKRASREGYDPEMIPQELKYSLEEAESLLADVQQRNQKLFLCQFVVMLNCETEAELLEAEKKIKNIAKKHSTELSDIDFMQEQGFQASLPLAQTKLPFYRTLTTGACAAFIPFTSTELMHRGSSSFYYGVNALSGNLIFCDRNKLMNPSGWILGKPGSGKSFKAKMEAIFAALCTKADIIIIDPENEYSRIAEKMKGLTLYIDNKSHSYLNPLDGNPCESDFVTTKSEYLQAMCSVILGDRQMTPQVISIIERCSRLIYADYLTKIEKKKKTLPPTFTTFYKKLKEQVDPEVQGMVTALEIYIEGNNNLFSKQSNVDINNRFVVYNTHELGKSLTPLAMLVILESLWDRIMQNFKVGKSTYIYVDEIHLFLKSKYCIEFFKSLWKRARKYGAIITGITQNVDELLMNTEICTMLSNSEFIIMLNQATSDSTQLSELLDISEEQMSYISNSDEGSGLLFNGKTIVPFKDEFPKETELYKLMTTKPSERAEIDLAV